MGRWKQHEDHSATRAHLRYEAQSKSMLFAYILWFFLGLFGVHRMYLGRWVSGIIMLVLSVFGWATSWILIGYGPLALVTIWWVIDALLTFMMVENHNDQLARDIT